MTEPLPRSRGTVLVQVLVAALFLAVIGGSVGLALGLRDRDGGATHGGAKQTTGVGQPTDSPPSTPCPEEASRRAGLGDLVQELYVRTDYSEVWICRDGGGALYYVGHRFTRDDWLGLSDVQRNGEEYVATNSNRDGTTVYRVSRDKLVIENAGVGEPEEQPVINSGG